MTEYKIIPMTAAHVPAVAALEQLCFPDPWNEAAVGSELVNPLSLWLVAMDGETLMGYAGSQTVLDETDMMNLAVSPDYRRRGVAKALVAALSRELYERGSRSLALEVRASNEAAIALYASLGFRQVGRRPNYYFHPREDALILRKELIL